MKNNNFELLKTKYNNDFNTALNIYINEFANKDLIEFLKNGTVAEKQAAVLKLSCINNQDEASALMEHLTECDGKIREAVSFKLKEFIPVNPEFYCDYAYKFLDAVIDINGNICRNTIEAIKYLKGNRLFTDNFCFELANRTLKLCEIVKQFDYNEGKYKINKQIFKLYWYLETISEFYEYIDYASLKAIMSSAKNIEEYTIREKIAKILTRVHPDNELDKIKKELQKDQNYYVRRVLS